MLSRNQEKINTKIDLLKQRHPAIKFQAVATDCSKKVSVQEYRDLIEQELKDLDIGIVCLNAGCWVEGPSDLVTDADFERTFGLNGLHVMYFTKALMPKLVGRGQKSALLATSSVLAHAKMPGIAAYTATKALVSNFMESLHFEIAHFCDVTCWEPGPCQTNLFENGTQPPKGVTITA